MQSASRGGDRGGGPSLEPHPDSGPLVDSFGRAVRYVRISVTDRCNLRCVYCMPEVGNTFLPTDQVMTPDEIGRIGGLLTRLGVAKIRLTGGEPLVRSDIVDIVARLGELDLPGGLALSTNGVLFSRYGVALREAGLDRVNFSLDALSDDGFKLMARRDDLGAVIESLELALSLDFEAVKLNAVIIRGYNEQEIEPLVGLARERAIEVRFIEFMPFGNNAWKQANLLSADEIRGAIEEPLDAIPDDRFPGPAEVYRGEGWKGRVGFIKPISDRFCARCNRIRITADGRLKACLFGLGDVDWLGDLRRGATDDEMIARLRRTVWSKEERHPLHPTMRKEQLELEARNMNQIGG